jgi:hypothetical protein
VDVKRLTRDIDRELRGRGRPIGLEHEKAYLKSELRHYGVTVPAIRAVATRTVSAHPALTAPGRCSGTTGRRAVGVGTSHPLIVLGEM